MMKNNIILIPTDFSEVCDNAIRHGVELAKVLNYQVTLLHVIDKATLSNLKKEQLGPAAIDEKLASIAATYKQGNDLVINWIAREGNIFDTIPKVAGEIEAEIMVLGTHGKVGLQHIMGSFAYKVVTSSPCPTIIVQNRSFEHGYKDIVFPIQEIDYVRQKVQWTIKVAKTFNATIHLYIIDTKNEELKSKFNIVTNQIKQIFDLHNVKHTVNFSEGSANFTKQVIKYASSVRADLLMIMSNNDLFDFKIAPDEEKLIFNDSEIPVLCINPRELYIYSMVL
ncbi:MAG: universal stress protein [Bacteroidetes bacterium]|nr:universal stress protein [Bacteroidota bacterium]